MDERRTSRQVGVEPLAGAVVEGQDVVDRIGAVKTATRGFHGDVPVEDVVIESAETA